MYLPPISSNITRTDAAKVGNAELVESIEWLVEPNNQHHGYHDAAGNPEAVPRPRRLPDARGQRQAISPPPGLPGVQR